MVDNLARKLDNAPKAEIEISEARKMVFGFVLPKWLNVVKDLKPAFLMSRQGKRGI